MLQGSKRAKAGGSTSARLLMVTLALAVGCVPATSPRRQAFHVEALRDQFEVFRPQGERIDKHKAKESVRSESDGATSRSSGAPSFSYDLYCDTQGRLTFVGADEALVSRPEHLHVVYQDAERGQARARALVRHLEKVFHDFGIWVADSTTSPKCLPLPELTPGCLPKLGFLDELLGRTPEAARLREVVAQAYEARARERGVQQAVISAVVNLLLAHGLATTVMTGAAEVPAGAGRGGNKLLPHPEAQGSHTSFKRDPTTGKISAYETYSPQSNPRNPNPWQFEKRVDTQYSKPHEHFNKTTQQDVPTPHVHDPLTPGGVRPAEPWELSP